jgi:hypothetical protein
MKLPVVLCLLLAVRALAQNPDPEVLDRLEACLASIDVEDQ